jgi:hypothetical protein
LEAVVGDIDEKWKVGSEFELAIGFDEAACMPEPQARVAKARSSSLASERALADVSLFLWRHAHPPPNPQKSRDYRFLPED